MTRSTTIRRRGLAGLRPPPKSSRHRTPARRRTRYSSMAPWRPGAPANTDKVPAKFSAKNAADDELIPIAYTFKTLTDDERRTIYQSLKDQPAGSAFDADIGTKLPPGIELRPVPDEVATRVPQTRDYRYAGAKYRVLLVPVSEGHREC